eukprot:Gb_26818 [translate_table: standard]
MLSYLPSPPNFNGGNGCYRPYVSTELPYPAEDFGVREITLAYLGDDDVAYLLLVFMSDIITSYYRFTQIARHLVAIASDFAKDQQHYNVTFITHAAHEYLSLHMAASNVSLFPISTPPVLPLQSNNAEAGALKCLDASAGFSETGM